MKSSFFAFSEKPVPLMYLLCGSTVHLRPPAGAMGAEPRPQRSARGQPLPLPTGCACRFAALRVDNTGCPPAPLPPPCLRKFPNTGSDIPSNTMNEWRGAPCQAFSRHGGRACPPRGVWGHRPLPWSRPRRRAGRRGEVRREASTPFSFTPLWGVICHVLRHELRSKLCPRDD